MTPRATTLLALGAFGALAFACEDLVGIADLPSSDAGDATSDVAPPNNYVCTNSTTFMTTSSTDLVSLKVGNGYVYAGGEGFGIMRCAAGDVCTPASDFINISPGNTFEDYAVATSSLFFTLQGAVGDAGSVHTAAFDGTNDQALLTNQTYPSWMAVSGSKTFWSEDSINGSLETTTTPSIVHCIGCNGPDSPWITGLGGTYGLMADASNVYVLADDGSADGTVGIYGCSVNTACGNGPRVVLTGADFVTTEQMMATDGTNVYASLIDAMDIVRVDGSGKQTPIVTNATFEAIAVDPATNDLFFATDSGLIETTKTDGTGLTKLSSCAPSLVDALAFDANNVYAIVQNNTTFALAVYAIPR